MHRNFFGHFTCLDDDKGRWNIIYDLHSWSHQFWSVWTPGATFNQLTGYQASKDLFSFDDSKGDTGTGACHLIAAIGFPTTELRQEYFFLQGNLTDKIGLNVEDHQPEFGHVNKNCLKICGLVLLIQCFGMHCGILGNIWEQIFRLDLKKRKRRALLRRSMVLSALASVCEFIAVFNICCEHPLVLSYQDSVCKIMWPFLLGAATCIIRSPGCYCAQEGYDQNLAAHYC